jgi:hypothetical protein
LNLFISTQLAGCAGDAVQATIPFIIIMIIDLAIMALFHDPLMLPHLLFDYA